MPKASREAHLNKKTEMVVEFPHGQTSLDWRTKVKMLGASQIAPQTPTPYATAADFCRIFREEMNRFYLLSFLLAGEQGIAEKCFVRGFEDVGKGNPVFREWAQSWARRTIIQKAIETVRPRPTDGGSANSNAGAVHTLAEPAEIAAIMELPAFERFAFVMSVLERISDQDSSLLLDCSRSEVIAARTRALQRLGKSAELRGNVVVTRARGDALREGPRSVVQPETLSRLTASA
jgi:DNA-directed RNA polymerase specialized sigma24 family protein